MLTVSRESRIHNNLKVANMTYKEIINAATSALSGFSEERKIYVLLLLSHNLTVSGRGVYSDRSGDPKTIQKFYTLNELQHRLSSQLMHLASKDGAAEPEDSFIESLYALACDGNCEAELSSALKYSLLSRDE